MNDDAVLVARQVSKHFKMYDSSLARLADWVGLPPGHRYEEFWALRDVSFGLRRGDCLGIIGPNGAGKSTLLKLLTGVLQPTSGTIESHGRVLSLLELGSDFVPELTGRQNVIESVRLLGLPRAETVDRMDEIETFAELGEYFDRPVKTYSSGMFVRLAFSLFSALQPELFLIDEALTVGDLRFSAKALARIRDMRAHGTTLVFVSHNLEVVSQLCDRVIWVHSGRVQMDGPAHDVTSAYVQFMVHGTHELPEQPVAAELPPPATAAAGTVWLGPGWHPLEAYAGEVFRWAEPVAELVIDPAASTCGSLVLELEPISGPDGQPITLSVDAGAGPPAQTKLTQRETVCLSWSAADCDGPRRLQLSTPDGGHRLPGDGRSVAFRAFRWGWSAEDLRSIDALRPWQGGGADPTLQHETRALHEALTKYVPVPGAKARIVGVQTCNPATGAPATRFVTHQAISLEIEVEALVDVPALVVGMEIKDAFGRGLYRTRTYDQQPDRLPSVRAGERMTVRFDCAQILLGQGVYHFVLGVGGGGLENEIWHLVDRAWSFQVLTQPDEPVYGIVDLNWQYAGQLAESRV